MKMLVISLSMAAWCGGPLRAAEAAAVMDQSVIPQGEPVETPIAVPEPSPAFVLLGTLGVLVLLRLRR